MRRLGVDVLVIAPVGGVLKKGRSRVTVQRTPLTARSIEFDAVIIAAGTTASADIKTVILLQEAYRHCKALGAWGDGAAGLEAAGLSTDAPGVVIGDEVGRPFTEELVAALGRHRA